MRLLSAALGAALLLPAGLRSQTIECVAPARSEKGCRLQLTKPDAKELLVVRVLDAAGQPVSAAAVDFDAPLGATTAAMSDARGVASTEWIRADVTKEVRIAVTARIGQTRVRDSIVIVPAPASAPTAWRIVSLFNDGAPWYVERQHPGAIGVHLSAPDSIQCTSVPTRVRFWARTEGGGVTPDTVTARWVRVTSVRERIGAVVRFRRPVGRGACMAQTRWRLGKEVGRQYLDAEIAGKPAERVRFQTTARALCHG